MGFYTAAHFFTNGTSDTNASNSIEANYLRNLTSTRLEYSQVRIITPAPINCARAPAKL